MKRIALLAASAFAMLALGAAPASAATAHHSGDNAGYHCWTHHHYYQCNDDWGDWDHGGLHLGLGLGLGLYL